MFGYQLIKSPGYKKPSVQRGRGNGTGRGNYSGRGLKGQHSRSGASTRPWFEGGQTPLIQRLPKLRGFKRNYKLVTLYKPVNLASLERDARVTDGMTINKEQLVILGFVNKSDKVKILGNGELSKKLTFSGMDAFSATATTKITEAGGNIA